MFQFIRLAVYSPAEQRKAAIRGVEKDLDKASELVSNILGLNLILDSFEKWILRCATLLLNFEPSTAPR